MELVHAAHWWPEEVFSLETGFSNRVQSWIQVQILSGARPRLL